MGSIHKQIFIGIYFQHPLQLPMYYYQRRRGCYIHIYYSIYEECFFGGVVERSYCVKGLALFLSLYSVSAMDGIEFTTSRKTAFISRELKFILVVW